MVLTDTYNILTDGPVNIIANASNEVYELVENSALGPIQCLADCYPPCILDWGKSEKAFGNPLTITSVRTTDAGQYTCTAKHPVKEYKATTNITMHVICKYHTKSLQMVMGIILISAF